MKKTVKIIYPHLGIIDEVEENETEETEENSAENLEETQQNFSL